MHTIPFLWTNDDIQYGQTEQLCRQLKLLDKLGIPGVMFLIPKVGDKTLADDPELLKTIERARKTGHEFYQHGYLHTPFESGVPELWMLDFAPDVRRDFDDRRLEIEVGHTLEALIAMIEAGHRIWRRAFHEESAGYRPGWGAFCGNLYRALDALGFSWVSSRLPSPTSWLWNQGLWDQPMNYRPKVPVAPCRMGSLWEYPIGGDYAFRVPHEEDKIQAMVELGWREFQYCHERKAPFLLVSHWHGLEHNEGSGYAVHERLLPRILKSGMAEPMNFSQLHARYPGPEKSEVGSQKPE